MSEVRTSITIAAAPERVWAVLTDFAAYPQWNTVISRVRAELREGGAIRFKIKIEGSPELGFAAPTANVGPTERKYGVESRLDAIYTRGLIVGEGHVERSVAGSDHWPVWVDVTLP